MDNRYDLDSDELNWELEPHPTTGSDLARDIVRIAYEQYKATHPSYELEPID